MYEYRAKLIRVVDGDTIHADVDLGCDIHINLTLRLFGINAPEIRTPEGVAARDWLITRLANLPDGQLAVHTVKDRKEKYGRYLATLIDQLEGDINQEMVTAGFAVPYSGGAR